MNASPTAPRPRFVRTLYFRVILGIVLGVLLGAFFPHSGESMKPLGDGFIKLIRMMIAPIIFFTVVVGIAGIGDMKKLGRVGLKALLYFEVVTTAALLIGLAVVKMVQPGAGMNVNPATLDASAVAQYAAQGKQLHTVDFLLNIIPSTVTSAFAQGEILQVLLVAILFGLALAAIPRNRAIVDACDKIAHWMFGVVGIIMEAAPLGAFGAMAFTIGKYGLKTLLPLLKLLCMRVSDELRVRLHRTGNHRLRERLQPVEVPQLHQRGVADRAQHFVIGIGAAAHDGEAGGTGLRQIGGGAGNSVGLLF